MTLIIAKTNKEKQPNLKSNYIMNSHVEVNEIITDANKKGESQIVY